MVTVLSILRTTPNFPQNLYKIYKPLMKVSDKKNYFKMLAFLLELPATLRSEEAVLVLLLNCIFGYPKQVSLLS